MIINTAHHYDSHRFDAANIKMDPASMILVPAYLYAGCYALIREWLIRDIDKTPREIAQLLVDIVNKDYL